MRPSRNASTSADGSTSAPRETFDQNRALFHPSELIRTDEMPRFGRQDAMHRQEVGLFENLIQSNQGQVAPTGRVMGDIGIVNQAAHAKAAAAPGHRLADTAKPDQPKRLRPPDRHHSTGLPARASHRPACPGRWSVIFLATPISKAKAWSATVSVP